MEKNKMITNKLCLEAFNKLDKPVYHPEEFFALGWQAAVEAMSKEFQNQFEKDGETQLIQLNEPQIDQEDKE
jgi:hypothetical protein